MIFVTRKRFVKLCMGRFGLSRFSANAVAAFARAVDGEHCGYKSAMDALLRGCVQ